MTIRERMIYAIDLVVDGAEKGLATFRTRLGEAGTASGKFKVGASEAMNQVKAHALGLAAAGGGAVLAFGAKAVTAFQEGALEAGKFAQATGLSNEAASRWVEIAGDIGIESSNLESAFGRFNKELGESPEKIAKLGVEVVKTNDGLVDTNATLANAIGRLGEIKDPTERAAAAQEMFGRSWQNMAELVGMSADDLKAQLAGVADAQVFDDDEVAKARELRAAWDDLSDKLQAFMLLVGGKLVPVLADAADKVTDTVEAVEPLADAIDDAAGAVDRFLDRLGPFGAGIKRVGTYLIPVYGQLKATGDAVGWLSDKLGIGGDKAGFFTGKLEDLTPAIESAASALADDMATAMEETIGQSGHASAAQREYERQLNATNAEVKANARELEGANWYIRKQAEDADNASREITGLKDAHAGLRAELEDRSAYLDLQDAFDNVQTAATEAYTAAAEGAEDAEAKARDHERAQIDLKNKVLDYIGALGGVPTEVATDVLALIDEGDLAAVEEKLAWLSRDRFAAVKVRLSGGTLTNDGGISFGGGVIAKKTGGPIPGARDQPVPMIGHGGEFMLSADVVDAIKRGQPTLGKGLGNGAATASGGGTVTISDQQMRQLGAVIASAIINAAPSLVNVGMTSTRYGQ